MASVSKCDCCGKIVKHKDCVFLKMYEEDSIGNRGKLIKTIEICSGCAEKLLEMFNANGSE